MFQFLKPDRSREPSPAPAGPSNGARMIDVAGMIRQASTLVSVGQLVRNGTRDIHLLSREKIDELISRALKTIVARYRAAGAPVDPSAEERMEADSRREFGDLLSQHRETEQAGEDLAQSRQALDEELRQMRADLAQQRELADGRLPREIEKAVLEKRFELLHSHLAAMDGALATLFSSKLYTYRQLQGLLRRAVAARKTAAVKARSAPLRPPIPAAVGVPAEAAPGEVGRRRVSFDEMDLEPGRGLDLGSVTLRAAARKAGGGTVHAVQRNAFLDVRDDAFARRLRSFDIDYVVRGDRGLVIGDPAVDLASTFERTLRRPMRDGRISPDEPEAVSILAYIVAQLLGLPRWAGETCAFSLPADPLDVDSDVIYHRSVIESAIADLGYTPLPVLEGRVIVSSELREQEYTGISLACGGGTASVCMSYKGLPMLAFSTRRGGDWIDASAAGALRLPVPLVCAEKEGGMDLVSPKGRVQEAIAIYARTFLRFTVEAMARKVGEAEHAPSFSKPVHLVCSGGTSMIDGFTDVLREELDRVELPFQVDTLRLAADPLQGVVAGCLQAALDEMAAPGSPSPAAAPELAATGRAVR